MLILQCIDKFRILPSSMGQYSNFNMYGAILKRGCDLLIRQIQPLLVLQLPVIRPCSECRFLLVLIAAIPIYERKIAETDTPTHDDGDLGWDVSWGIFRAEGLWTYPMLAVSLIMLVSTQRMVAYR